MYVGVYVVVYVAIRVWVHKHTNIPCHITNTPQQTQTNTPQIFKRGPTRDAHNKRPLKGPLALGGTQSFHRDTITGVHCRVKDLPGEELHTKYTRKQCKCTGQLNHIFDLLVFLCICTMCVLRCALCFSLVCVIVCFVFRQTDASHVIANQPLHTLSSHTCPPVSGSRPSSMCSPRTSPCMLINTRYNPCTR